MYLRHHMTHRIGVVSYIHWSSFAKLSRTSLQNCGQHEQQLTTAASAACTRMLSTQLAYRVQVMYDDHTYCSSLMSSSALKPDALTLSSKRPSSSPCTLSKLQCTHSKAHTSEVNAVLCVICTLECCMHESCTLLLSLRCSYNDAARRSLSGDSALLAAVT
jgi:hypothetical protein